MQAAHTRAWGLKNEAKLEPVHLLSLTYYARRLYSRGGVGALIPLASSLDVAPRC